MGILEMRGAARDAGLRSRIRGIRFGCEIVLAVCFLALLD